MHVRLELIPISFLRQFWRNLIAIALSSILWLLNNISLFHFTWYNKHQYCCRVTFWVYQGFYLYWKSEISNFLLIRAIQEHLPLVLNKSETIEGENILRRNNLAAAFKECWTIFPIRLVSISRSSAVWRDDMKLRTVST